MCIGSFFGVFLPLNGSREKTKKNKTTFFKNTHVCEDRAQKQSKWRANLTGNFQAREPYAWATRRDLLSFTKLKRIVWLCRNTRGECLQTVDDLNCTRRSDCSLWEEPGVFNLKCQDAAVCGSTASSLLQINNKKSSCLTEWPTDTGQI